MDSEQSSHIDARANQELKPYCEFCSDNGKFNGCNNCGRLSPSYFSTRRAGAITFGYLIFLLFPQVLCIQGYLFHPGPSAHTLLFINTLITLVAVELSSFVKPRKDLNTTLLRQIFSAMTILLFLISTGYALSYKDANLLFIPIAGACLAFTLYLYTPSETQVIANNTLPVPITAYPKCPNCLRRIPPAHKECPLCQTKLPQPSTWFKDPILLASSSYGISYLVTFYRFAYSPSLPPNSEHISTDLVATFFIFAPIVYAPLIFTLFSRNTILTVSKKPKARTPFAVALQKASLKKYKNQPLHQTLSFSILLICLVTLDMLITSNGSAPFQFFFFHHLAIALCVTNILIKVFKAYT